MRPTQPTKRFDRLLCALAILCFMVQQLAAPVFCVLHEHEIGDGGLVLAGVEHCPTHVGRDHMHGDEVVHSGEEDPDHEPHPVEDELARLVEKLAPRVPSSTVMESVVCLHWEWAALSEAEPCLVGLAWCGAHPVHGPPDLVGQAPRGPPVIV
ncbi:MAG: hypothetical protein JKY61_12275 [Planctomycetes bacterium]|nr:hypothetical protein [Planctomycetota bacterium]